MAPRMGNAAEVDRKGMATLDRVLVPPMGRTWPLFHLAFHAAVTQADWEQLRQPAACHGVQEAACAGKGPRRGTVVFVVRCKAREVAAACRENDGVPCGPSQPGQIHISKARRRQRRLPETHGSCFSGRIWGPYRGYRAPLPDRSLLALHLSCSGRDVGEASKVGRMAR